MTPTQVQPHPYRTWISEDDDVGMTCCLLPRLDPIHIDPRVVRFHVQGLPRPQGSLKMHALPNGHVAARYPAAVWEWRSQVQQAAADALGPGSPITGAVDLRLGFDLPRPIGHFGTGRNAGTVKPSAPAHPTVAPDLDKLTRCIGDAITDAGLWKDDAQVVAISAAKRYASPPGVHITITELL